jgi:hypothetical protein
MVTLFIPPTDPRYNAFDWETWHELDVLRRELAPRFEAKEPGIVAEAPLAGRGRIPAPST